MNTIGTRCHRCLEPMTLFVVGDDYCAKCRRDIKVREAQDARRADRFARYRVSKDTTGWVPGGAA